MALKDIVININIREVIKLHDILKRYQSYCIENNVYNVQDEHFELPLFKYLQFLDDKLKIEATDKKIRINFYLNTKILEEADSIIKCNECSYPITQNLTSPEKFELVFHNKINFEEEKSKNDDDDEDIQSSSTIVQNCQLLDKFHSRVELPIEMYFMDYMEEFNIVPKGAIMKDIIDFQLDNLQKKADNPENYKKLQIVRNLNDLVLNITIDKKFPMLQSLIKKHEKEEYKTNYSDIGVQKFLQKHKEKDRNSDSEEEDYSDIVYSALNKLALYNLSHRGNHKAYQDKTRRMLNKLEEKLDNLEFKSKHYTNELEKTQEKCKSVRDVIYEMVSKKRNFFDLNDDEKNKRAENPVSHKLDNFFNEFDPKGKDLKRDQVKSIYNQKKILEKNFAAYGKFPLTYLKQMKVLVDIKLKNERIEKLFKKSSLIFYDEGDLGLKINMVYVEKGVTKMFKKNSNEFEAILTTFNIDTRSLLRMRRQKSNKNIVIFGEGTYNIFELTNFLNSLFSKAIIQ